VEDAQPASSQTKAGSGPASSRTTASPITAFESAYTSSRLHPNQSQCDVCRAQSSAAEQTTNALDVTGGGDKHFEEATMMDRKRAYTPDLPRYHHDNPWRAAQRTKSLMQIRQLHYPFQNCQILSTTAPNVVVTNSNPLVMAIAAHVGSRGFTIRDLKRHAARVKGPLQSAIKDIDLGNELRKINGKRRRLLHKERWPCWPRCRALARF
jgi:hypothetical protein